MTTPDCERALVGLCSFGATSFFGVGSYLTAVHHPFYATGIALVGFASIALGIEYFTECGLDVDDSPLESTASLEHTLNSTPSF